MDGYRQAQELGLHRLPQNIEQTRTWEEPDLVFCDLEHRKRVWARLFTWDRQVYPSLRIDLANTFSALAPCC